MYLKLTKSQLTILQLTTLQHTTSTLYQTAMASPSVAIELLLASSIRVSRHYITAQDLIAVYPSLIEKSLTSPSILIDTERRLLLDLPDKDIEASNIASITNLSRSQLLSKATSNPASLTQ